MLTFWITLSSSLFLHFTSTPTPEPTSSTRRRASSIVVEFSNQTNSFHLSATTVHNFQSDHLIKYLDSKTKLHSIMCCTRTMAMSTKCCKAAKNVKVPGPRRNARNYVRISTKLNKVAAAPHLLGWKDPCLHTTQKWFQSRQQDGI
jgi:hypothetical protein